MIPNEWRQAKPRGIVSKRTSLDSPEQASELPAQSKLHGWEEASPAEIILRKFDMDMRMGPCLGLTRLERWNRAKALGLNPSVEILRLIQSTEAICQSLWDQDNRIPSANK